jgi:predicted NBD/HSP70 family sugar kinase
VQTTPLGNGASRPSDDAEPTESGIPSRADQSEVRRNNLELVLRHLSTRRDSRAGIAGRAGLTRATVSRLVAELISLGLVREDGHHQTGNNGRPGTALRLDGRHVLGIGAEINVDYLAVNVVDLAGHSMYSQRKAFGANRAGVEQTVVALSELIQRANEIAVEHVAVSFADDQSSPRTPFLVGVSVAVAGIVDVEAGSVANAPNLKWVDADLAGPLRAALAWPEAPIAIYNEANLCAIAESRFGAFAGSTNMVYVTGSVGVGGGIIAGGRAMLGQHGHGGEVGHMTVDVNGPRCGCGRLGCWEAYIGLSAVLREAGIVDVDTDPLDDRLSRLVSAAERGDEQTLVALAQAGRWIGVGAANLANILNPQAVIVGGYFAELQRWLMPSAQVTFSERVFGPVDQVGVLAASTLGFGAATLGGAIAMIERVVTDPTQLQNEGEFPI